MLNKNSIEKMIYLIRKIHILLIAFFILFSTSAGSVENRIVYKINNEIITSFDLNKEFKYLKLINPKITNLDISNAEIEQAIKTQKGLLS